MSARHRVCVRKPEAARQECALAGWQAVVSLVRVIAQDEAIAQQALFDRLDRAEQTRIVQRQKSQLGHLQQARVEKLRAVRLHEAVALRVVTTLADLRMNLRAQLAPVLERTLEAVRLGILDAAIECDPRHDLRMREVLRRAANLPDAAIRLVPDLLQVLEQLTLQRPGSCRLLDAAQTCLV